MRTVDQQNKSVYDRNTSFSRTYQVIEYISLVDMDCDKRLIFDPVKFGQVVGGLFNECAEQTQKVLFGIKHDLSVVFSIFQGLLCISGPKHLDTQQAHL